MCVSERERPTPAHRVTAKRQRIVRAGGGRLSGRDVVGPVALEVTQERPSGVPGRHGHRDESTYPVGHIPNAREV
jgi:hypothetical protein